MRAPLFPEEMGLSLETWGKNVIDTRSSIHHLSMVLTNAVRKGVASNSGLGFPGVPLT